MAPPLVFWRPPSEARLPPPAPRWGLVAWRRRREQVELNRLAEDAHRSRDFLAARVSPATRLLPPPPAVPPQPHSATLTCLRLRASQTSRPPGPLSLSEILTQPLGSESFASMPAAPLNQFLAHAIDGAFSGMDLSVPVTERPLGLALLELQARAERRLQHPVQRYLLRLSGQFLLEEAEETRIAATGTSARLLWPTEAEQGEWHRHRCNLFTVIVGLEEQRPIGQLDGWELWLPVCAWLLAPAAFLGLVRCLGHRPSP